MKKLLLAVLLLFCSLSRTFACDEAEGVVTGVVSNGDGTYNVTYRICVGVNSSTGAGNTINVSFAGANVTSIACGGYPNWSVEYDISGSPACDGNATFAGSTSIVSGAVVITGTHAINPLINAAGDLSPDFAGSVCNTASPSIDSAQPSGNCTPAPVFMDVDGTDAQYGLCWTTTVVVDAYPTSWTATGLEAGGCDIIADAAPFPQPVLCPEPFNAVPVFDAATCSFSGTYFVSIDGDPSTVPTWNGTTYTNVETVSSCPPSATVFDAGFFVAGTTAADFLAGTGVLDPGTPANTGTCLWDTYDFVGISGYSGDLTIPAPDCATPQTCAENVLVTPMQDLVPPDPAFDYSALLSITGGNCDCGSYTPIAVAFDAAADPLCTAAMTISVNGGAGPNAASCGTAAADDVIEILQEVPAGSGCNVVLYTATVPHTACSCTPTIDYSVPLAVCSGAPVDFTVGPLCSGFTGFGTTGTYIDLYYYFDGTATEAPAGYEATLPTGSTYPDPFGDGNLTNFVSDGLCVNQQDLGWINNSCDPFVATYFAFVFDYNTDVDGDGFGDYCSVVRYDVAIYPAPPTLEGVPGACGTAAVLNLVAADGTVCSAFKTGTVPVEPACTVTAGTANDNQPIPAGTATALEIGTALGAADGSCYADINYSEVAADCLSPACAGCPATTVTNDTGTTCSGGTDDLATWQAAVATANASGLVYSSVTPVAGTILPNGTLPSGTNTGCTVITQTVMAYVYCDVDASTTVNAGDTYTLVSTYTLTVYPAAAGFTVNPVPGSCGTAASAQLRCGGSTIATESGTAPTCAAPSQPFSGSFTAAEIAAVIGNGATATCYSDITYGPIAATCAATPAATVSASGSVCVTGTGTATLDLMTLVTAGNTGGTWSVSGSANGTSLAASTLSAGTAVAGATVTVVYTIAATADCAQNTYTATITVNDCIGCQASPNMMWGN